MLQVKMSNGLIYRVDLTPQELIYRTYDDLAVDAVTDAPFKAHQIPVTIFCSQIVSFREFSK